MTTGAAIGGKYRLLRQLGKGSMAEVWAAEHVELGREVAIKLIYEGSPELATRLKREAQACGRLYHPNIVRVYDFGETEAGDPFLVMELLEGETLAERLARRQRLPLDEALPIILRVARALGAAHEAGVVHRDLKPANVFLARTAQGEVVKVLDFGVSKLLSVDDMGVTTTGAIVGSPAYMSPEQARALREIDARADLWSLGVLLFEMITGQRPFPAQTVVGVVTEILAGTIPALSEVMPNVDPRLDEAVRRCLTRDVERRMPSAAALIDAVTPVLASLKSEDDDDEDQKTLARPANAALLGVARVHALPPPPPPDAPPDDPDDPTSVMRAKHAFPFPAPRPSAPRPERPKPPRVDWLRDEATRVDGQRAEPPRSEVTRVEGPPAALRAEPQPPPPEPAPRLDALATDSTTRLIAPPPTVAPTSDDMPTLANVKGPPLVPRAAEAPGVVTKLIVHPFATPPSPVASAHPAWDTAPTLRRNPPMVQPRVFVESNHPTLVGTEAPVARRNAAQVLWMTAIAGIVVGLVVFAGLSLLR